MKSKALDYIVEWKKLSNKITEQFLYDYFDDLDPYYWWVGDEEEKIILMLKRYLNDNRRAV